MGAHVPHVTWRCAVCPRVEQRMPSDAKAKCCYGCRGAYLRMFGAVGVRRGVENRIRRVMFVKGLNAHDARIFVNGWRDGYQAGRQAEFRVLRGGLRVGSAEWEKSA